MKKDLVVWKNYRILHLRWLVEANSNKTDYVLKPDTNYLKKFFENKFGSVKNVSYIT